MKSFFGNYIRAWKRGELAPLLYYHLRHGFKATLPELLGPKDPIASPSELHQKLQKEKPLSFSVLMPVYKPDPRFLKIAIDSVLAQSAPDFELLIGLDGPQPDAVLKCIESYTDKVRLFSFEWGGISITTNRLVERAKGDYLLLMDHDDWIAPDLLYHYHQNIRPNCFFYCDEFKIDEFDTIWPHTYFKKPLTPPFPFVFFNTVTHALMIAKKDWIALRPETDGAQDFDLVLRLHQKGVKGCNVGLPLYAWRMHLKSTAKKSAQKKDVGLKVMQDFQPDWAFAPGLAPFTYRAKPPLITPDVHYFGPKLTPEAFEEMARFAMQPQIGFVTANACDPFFFPVQRVVQTVPPGCFMIRKELISPQEAELLPYHGNPQPIADRLTSSGYHHLYTPYS